MEKQLPWDPVITKKWLPVHMYTGGAEHSVLHLLYSRFVTMALHDWGLLDFEEPFTRFFAHGLVIKDGAKMSKSKGNVVTPDEYIDSYGADALRLYLMFMGPFSQGGDFRDSAMEGMYKWVKRVWRIGEESTQASSLKPQAASVDIQSGDYDVERALAKLVAAVGSDIEHRRYNTAIAKMMEFTNLVGDKGGILPPGALKTFLIILAPFAPFLTEELWYMSCKDSPCNPARRVLAEADQSIHLQAWPAVDPELIKEDTVTIVVQVNGKLRDTIVSLKPQDASRKQVEKLARESQNVQKFLTGREVKKIIFVPGRLINFVT